MMIMWACMLTMMIMYDDYDRYEAYDGHLEGCIDPTVDRGWTDSAQDGILPARPAVDRRVVIIPVSKAPPLHDTIQLSSCSLSYLMSYRALCHVCTTASVCRSQLVAKNLNVLVQIYKDVPQHITGDKHRLQHVIDNLLLNAIKVCPGDSDICLSMSYENKFKDSVTFAVRDQGPGITNEDKKLLFEPFMVVRPGELHQGRGSGLGLSISRSMVELHAGSLDCSSTMRMDNSDITSGGTELSFTVPVDSTSNVVHEDDGALSMLNPSSDIMTGIMSYEMLSKKNRYCKCDEERSLQVLAAAKVLSEQQQQQQQQLTTQAETVSRALDMSEKLVDVLIDQDEVRKTERILIVDGRLTIQVQACFMYVTMWTH